MKPQVSSRAQQMPASPIRKLMPLADDAKRRGVHVYHLNIGQPDIETPACMLDRLKTIKEKTLAYSPSGGTPEYLESIRFYYDRLGITLTTKQILATTGGSEAVLFALFSTTSVGDDVLVIEPFYANYNAFANMAGVNLVAVTSVGNTGFHLPARDAFEKAITPKTRSLLLCNPNNPTGTVYSQDELTMVAEICRDRGLFLISDEVYREFVYDGGTSFSALTLAGYEELVIVVDSLSKRYSACGIRLGSLVTRNSSVFDAALKMAQGRLSPPGLAQSIAVGAMSLGAEYTQNVITEYQKRRDILFEGLGAIPGVFLRKPEGAFYFVARLPVRDSEHFAAWLLSDFNHEGATVMVAPAPSFYATPGLGKDEVRIAYVLNGDSLKKSVDIFRAALERYAELGFGSAAVEPAVSTRI